MVDPASLHATRCDCAAKVLTAAFFTAATLLATGPTVLAQSASQGQQSSKHGSSCAGDNGGITLSLGFCATIFADNLVPHVLRMDGVMLYAPDLAAWIDREELIPAGSPEEVEIRAAALHAVELMVGELRNAGRAATAMGIDFILWNRGHHPDYKRAKPRHRTRTVFY